MSAQSTAEVLTQAAGFALLAAVSPTAVLVAAVFLGSATPRRTALTYLAGAVVMTGLMAAIVYFLLHTVGHIQRPSQHHIRYGIRLGLGLVMLGAGSYLWRRGRRQPDPAKKGNGLLSRLMAKPGGSAAFLVGVILYSPSIAFIAAVQVVAAANGSVAVVILGILVVIVITIAFVWLPLVLYLLTPERTGRTLASLNSWLREHGHRLAVGALLAGGVVLTINGILGVTGVIG